MSYNRDQGWRWALRAALAAMVMGGCGGGGNSGGGNSSTGSGGSSACGEACAAGEVCVGGVCELACAGGTTACNGACVDVKLDPANCGACGEACAAGEVCAAGVCGLACAGGTTACKGACVDIEVDPANCGACGAPCAAGEVCAAGACKLACTGGTTACSDACVDMKVDPANCGACNKACAASEECSNGTCKALNCAPTSLFFETFSDNSQGWTLDTEWAIGSATASTGHEDGSPDPSSDHTPTADNGVAGVVIGGNATKTVHDYYNLTSPVIDTSGYSRVTFEFWRFLNSDNWLELGRDTTKRFMQNRIEVFDGTNWQTIWQTGEASVNDSFWTYQSFDISAYANKTLQVRIGFQVGSDQVFNVSGWNVDDVSIIGVTCN